MKKVLIYLLLISILFLNVLQGTAAASKIYIPITYSDVPPATGIPIINAPYFNISGGIDFSKMAIFWLGKVTPDEVYADVRIGYNNSELEFHVAIFDRRLWYDPNLDTADFTQWDSVTITIQTGSGSVSAPSTNSYKFMSSLHWWEPENASARSYKGNGASWVQQSIPFSTLGGWRTGPNGGAINDNADDRGWTTDFNIPFTSLGLTGKPATGTQWRLGVAVYNRNGSSIAPAAPKYWPENSTTNSPATWGILNFGIPSQSSPAVRNLQTTTIRQGLNGASVKEGGVGGGTICGDYLDYFSDWGNKNYNGDETFNIQNQHDVADWPCYSKYFVSFPISSIPPSKVIKSATFRAYEFGGSDPSSAIESYIQAITVANDWNEATINWNNAPAFQENISGTWVQPYPWEKWGEWPGDQYNWDVRRAVSQAYYRGTPVRIVLYSADTEYHSGKYFSTSKTADWNAIARPTLIIEWGDP